MSGVNTVRSARPAQSARRRALPLLVAAPALSLSLLMPAAPAGAADSSAVIGGPQLGTSAIVVGRGATSPPPDGAASWLVADLTTGQILAAKAPHEKHRPASTLKTLTTITLMPRLNPATVHLVTAAEQAPVYGSRAGIVVGGTYTVDQLWHGLLLPSGNDAAAALAATYGGVAKTVAAMRAEAIHLQARDTSVVNPSGLDADGQYSSAYDLALFARAALALPEFRAVTQTVEYDFPGKMVPAGQKRPTYKIYGENRLLNHGYPGTIGGKTGFTSLAGRTFWVAAAQNGHTVLVTMMKITTATEPAATALMTWGLKNDGRVTPIGTLVDPVSTPVASSLSPATTATTPDGTSTAAPAAVDTTSTSTGTLVLVAALAVLAVLVGAWLIVSRRHPKDAVEPATAVAGLASAAPLPPVTPQSVNLLPGTPPAATPAGTPPAVTPLAVTTPAGTPPTVTTPAVTPPAGKPAVPPLTADPPLLDPVRAKQEPIAPTGNVTVIRPSPPPED